MILHPLTYTDQTDTTLKRLTVQVNNNGHLVSMRWSSGKLSSLAFMWMPLNMPHPPKPCHRLSTPIHGKGTLWWQWPSPAGQWNVIKSDARCDRRPPRSLCPWLERSDYRPQLDVLSSELFQEVPLMVNQIRVWGIWKQGQHLELLVKIFGPHLSSSCSVAEPSELSCCEGHCQRG